MRQLSDKSDKSVSLLFPFMGKPQISQIEGICSLALVIKIPKIPNICVFFFITLLYLLGVAPTALTKNIIIVTALSDCPFRCRSLAFPSAADLFDVQS